jgi:uncharacterized iron-regulated membrane protein
VRPAFLSETLRRLVGGVQTMELSSLRHASDRRPGRPLAFLLHSLLGLKLSLFVFFVCATGTIAVVSHEIEWVFSPTVRASRPGEAVSWGTQYAAAKATYPTHAISGIEAGEESYLATTVHATNSAGERRVIYVDPATGRVTGESGWVTFSAFMRGLHYYLFIPDDWGFYAVTALGFVLMGSAVTGLIIYKKFWRGFFTLPRTDRSARVWWGGLHKLIGLWSVWFVFLIALTSMWYFVERLLYRVGVNFETPRAAISAESLAALGPETPQPLPLDELVAIAHRKIPDLEVKQIWFPDHPEEPIFIRGQASAWLVRDRTNSVELNPYTGEVLSVLRAEAMPLMERWVHTADPLHFGDFGGPWSKLVWVGFGLLMCLSAASGAVIYAKRTVKATALFRQTPVNPAPASGVVE